MIKGTNHSVPFVFYYEKRGKKVQIILCLDLQNGILFHQRRQSRDRNIIFDILKNHQENTLWIHPFSKILFAEHMPDVRIDENLLDRAGERDTCFIEHLLLTPYQEKIKKIIVYRWQKAYPCDWKTDIPIQKWNQIQTTTIQGYSHDTIVKEVYMK